MQAAVLLRVPGYSIPVMFNRLSLAAVILDLWLLWSLCPSLPCSLSIRYRGCAVPSQSWALQGHVFSPSWAAVDLCNSFCELQEVAVLRCAGCTYSESVCCLFLFLFNYVSVCGCLWVLVDKEARELCWIPLVELQAVVYFWSGSWEPDVCPLWEHEEPFPTEPSLQHTGTKSEV